MCCVFLLSEDGRKAEYISKENIMLIFDEKESWNRWKVYQFHRYDSRCGYFTLIDEGNYTSIYNVFIFPKYRGKKLCEQMMKECLDLVMALFPNYNKTILFVRVENIPAIKSYERAGFIYSDINKYGEHIRKMEYNYG